MLARQKLFMPENSKRFFLLFLALPVVVFLYFLPWKTHVFYGDDLYTYRQYVGLTTFSEKMNMSVAAEKFRPIQGIGLQLLIDTFGNNSHAYYWFNVLIQSINALIFALVLNLYLNSPFVSIFIGLLMGLSRFAFFNVTQLMNGGAMEGLALSFFLAFLYFVIKHLQSESTQPRGSRNILYAILFANLSMYTHERYIVLLPFLLVVLLFDATVKKVKQRQQGLVLCLILGSILFNVLIKKYVFAIPFFVGTAGTHIHFSFSNSFSFLKEAILAIFLVNIGPDYLDGIQFSSLIQFYRILIIILCLFSLSVIIAYLLKEFRKTSSKKKYLSQGIINFLLLGVLFFLCLAPAIMSIRLEQRWLQASFSIFILMVVIAVASFKFTSTVLRNRVLTLFVLFFLLADHEYLSEGANNLSLSSAENLAAVVKRAIDNGTIRSSSKNLYLCEDRKDENAEIAANWIFAGGYFFEFYSGRSKNMIYFDSAYQRIHTAADTTFADFSPQTDQIMYVTTTHVYDLTDKYLRDSLKNFDGRQIESAVIPYKPKYDSLVVIVNTDNFSNFNVNGFYKKEMGFRWTNGQASIGFEGGYRTRDSIDITLNTYMPPICKNVLPRITLVNGDNKSFQPVSFERTGDIFKYRFYFKEWITVQKIDILSDTIVATPPDTRTLSFPFKGLILKRQSK